MQTLSFIGLGVAFLIILTLWFQLRRHSRRFQKEIESLSAKVSALESENARLRRFSVVADADGEAQRLVREGQARHQEALLVATEIRSQAASDAEKIVTEAREKAKIFNSKAESTLNAATLRAADVIEQANARAEEIAGKAYDAMKNATLYEDTAKAMKNIIEGYGDRYLLPVQSLLDELAEGFSYTEAGEKLKYARQHTRMMIDNGTAATCEYVETNRRQTAIDFVVDAFNGKVDSVLTRVKKDNEGTLAQAIRDAFTVVNFNGKPFRDARITEAYLDARLEELRWASVTQELREIEREEQRRIKEHLREEERARREFERAIKDAEKEEELLKKAMQKASDLLAKASEEQKFKYEQQLLELQNKLAEAEARGQRALSMAQQTRRGHVYVISNVGSFGEHIYKIGLTRRLEPLDRIRELGDSSVPFEFDVHALIFSEDAPGLETRLHKHFLLSQVNKVNPRKEFFRADLAHIREEIEKLSINAHWTMAAAAREYKETLAIERAINDNPSQRDVWLKGQLQFESLEDSSPVNEEAVEV